GSSGGRVERSRGLLRRFNLQLRRYDVAQGLEAQGIVNHEVVEGDETDRLSILDQRDAPDAVMPHEAHDLVYIRADFTGDDVLRHDIAKRRRLRVQPAAEHGKRQVAIGNDACDAAPV